MQRLKETTRGHTTFPACGHTMCWNAAIDRGDGRQVVCELEEEELEEEEACDHGTSVDDHHGCIECAIERADWMLDDARENGT